MPPIDNEKFYIYAMELYGVSAKGVNWNASSSQDLRFKIILELLPPNFEDRLPKEYIPIDSIQKMVRVTKELFETHLFMQNCYASSEVGFIFNILCESNKSQTYNYLSLSDIKTITSKIGVREFKVKENYMKNDVTIGFF